MADLLMREASPLTAEEWGKLDHVVVEVAKKTLVARRFISLYGPLGAGQMTVPAYRYDGASFQASGGPIAVSSREYVPFAMLQKDFSLNYSELALGRQQAGGIDLTPAAIASNLCSLAEDAFVFGALVEGKGRTIVKMGDWDVAGGAFADVVAGIDKLTQAGILPGYALVTSPGLYAKLHRLLGNSGTLEIEQIRHLAEVYQSPVLGAKQALLVGTGRENLDIAIGQDLITAYHGNQGMDHLFKVFETLVVRVKRSPAICTFE